jgi:hypothetical protein
VPGEPFQLHVRCSSDHIQSAGMRVKSVLLANINAAFDGGAVKSCERVAFASSGKQPRGIALNVEVDRAGARPMKDELDRKVSTIGTCYLRGPMKDRRCE